MNIEDKIKQRLVTHHGVEARTETDTVESLGLDSLDQIEMVMWLEDEFNLTIDDNEAVKWKTLAEVVAYIK